nr:dienelactone hydrolase family protein [Zoogloeaceae bacterium]
MSKPAMYLLTSAMFCLFSPLVEAGGSSGCRDGSLSGMSFVEFESFDPSTQPPTPLVVKGTLRIPEPGGGKSRCVSSRRKLPAVVILHSSGGIDATGTFYAEALNEAGVATLEIDMWEARGVMSPADRPLAPIAVYPDAFAALAFLGTVPGVAADRVGVLGFSLGGVASLATSEQTYAMAFGGQALRFKAHVANYPVCHGANMGFFGLPAEAVGTTFRNLTGAPVLIQVGSKDDYDNGAGPCRALAQEVNVINKKVVEVVEYRGAYHAWDRLMVPITVPDIFGDQGSYFETGVVPEVDLQPDVEKAQASRKRVVSFFRRHL